MGESHFYIYIVASRSLTLYVGFTSNLEGRIAQHKRGTYEGFSKAYKCHRLVYFERFQTAVVAIAREKQLKRWSRGKKIALIRLMNPAWADLSEDWGKPVELFRGPRD